MKGDLGLAQEARPLISITKCLNISFRVMSYLAMCYFYFQEIKFEPCVMCEHLDKRTSFRLSQVLFFCFFVHWICAMLSYSVVIDLIHFNLQLEDGDIICFQKTPLAGEEDCRYPDVPSFLEYVHNRQVKCFYLPKHEKENVRLFFSRMLN